MNICNTISLGCIEFIDDYNFRNIINDSLPLEYFDDKISFTNLKYAYNDEYNDLSSKIVISAANNGASEYYTNIISNYLDSFQLGNYYFRPVLNIPYSNEVNLTLNPLLGINWIVCSDHILIHDYINNVNHIVSEASGDSIFRNNPCWLVTLRYKEVGTNNWLEYMPFRRCTCPRVKRPDGSVPSIGKCNGKYDGLAPVCERADLRGNCSGVSCNAGVMESVLLPVFK